MACHCSATVSLFLSSLFFHSPFLLHHFAFVSVAPSLITIFGRMNRVGWGDGPRCVNTTDKELKEVDDLTLIKRKFPPLMFSFLHLSVSFCPLHLFLSFSESIHTWKEISVLRDKHTGLPFSQWPHWNYISKVPRVLSIYTSMSPLAVSVFSSLPCWSVGPPHKSTDLNTNQPQHQNHSQIKCNIDIHPSHACSHTSFYYVLGLSIEMSAVRPHLSNCRVSVCIMWFPVSFWSFALMCSVLPLTSSFCRISCPFYVFYLYLVQE